MSVETVPLAQPIVEGDCGLIAIRRGETNALNEQLVAQISVALSSLAQNASINTIVIDGGPHIFMAGADLPFFARCLLQNDIGRILTFTRACHDLLGQIESCDKPVLAWVRGAALGAGVELALACQRIVASPEAKFALPETGLGIYPGMGGTQRGPRRIGIGLAKWLIGTGSTLPAAAALEIGLIDRIQPSAQCANEVAELAQPRIAQPMISDRYRQLEQLFGEHTFAELVDPAFTASRDPQCIRALVQLRSKGPLALRIAEQLIVQGMNSPLEEGLALEFSRLAEIFATEDARTGILSFGKTVPSFAGR